MKFFIVITLLFCSIYHVNCRNFDMPFPCSNNVMCTSQFPDNSACRGGVCVCLENGNYKNCSMSHKSLMEPKSLGGVIGRICKYDINCGSENIWCNTTNSQCQCKPHYVGDSTNNRCLPMVTSIGGRCDDSKQCQVKFPSTTCSDNQCVCANGFHHINGKCWKSIGFGETCDSDEECSHEEYTTCNEQKVCACSSNSALNSDGKRCLPLARSIMQECTESVQCAKAFAEADCVDKRCQCWDKSHFVTTIGKCIPNKGLGEACREDYECYQGTLSDEIQSLKCTDRICVCAEKFNDVGGKCVLTDSATTGRISLGLITILLLVTVF